MKEKKLTSLKKGVIFGLGFSIVILTGGLIHATLTWNNLPNVTTETELTANIWNDMVKALNSIKFEVNNSNSQMDSMNTVIENTIGITDLTSSMVSCLSNNRVKLTSQKTWQNAIDNCSALGEKWRLPTKDEMVAMGNATTCNSGLSLGASTYWSITPYTTTNPDISAEFAYHIHMNDRTADNDYKTHLNYVVCTHP